MRTWNLVYPDPMSPKDLISWNRAITTIEKTSEDQRQVFLATYLTKARNHPDEIVRRRVELELERDAEYSRPRLGLLGAYSSGGPAVYVEYEGYALEVILDVWRGARTPIADPVTLVSCGEFQIVTNLLPRSSLESKLAGRPLFLRKADLKMLLKPNSGSKAGRLKSAREFIQTYREQNPESWMTIEEFLGLMQAKYPGAAERELMRVREEVWPQEWKEKRGRRPGR